MATNARIYMYLQPGSELVGFNNCTENHRIYQVDIFND